MAVGLGLPTAKTRKRQGAIGKQSPLPHAIHKCRIKLKDASVLPGECGLLQSSAYPTPMLQPHANANHNCNDDRLRDRVVLGKRRTMVVLG